MVGRDAEDQRFSEAVRFLEHEILDDVIAGDTDRIDLEPAFSLLGITGVAGWAVAVRPDLESYPFRLENDRQRRTVVERVLTAMEEALKRGVMAEGDGTSGTHGRVLKRAHPDMGYFICLGGSRKDRSEEPMEDLPDRVRRAVEFAGERTSLAVRYELSRHFADAGEMSEAIRIARRACHTAESDLIDEQSDVMERRLLKVLLSGTSDDTRAGQEAELSLIHISEPTRPY